MCSYLIIPTSICIHKASTSCSLSIINAMLEGPQVESVQISIPKWFSSAYCRVITSYAVYLKGMEYYIRYDVGVDRDRLQVDKAKWILQNTLQYYTFAFTM